MKNGITGNLYKEYKRQGGKLTERSFRTYIKRLEQMGLIKTKETGKGFRGRSRVIEYGD
jgi:Cdc6-like AAA superfamily ATPase